MRLVELICMVVLFGALAFRTILAASRYSLGLKWLLPITTLMFFGLMFVGEQNANFYWMFLIAVIFAVLASIMLMIESLKRPKTS